MAAISLMIQLYFNKWWLTAVFVGLVLAGQVQKFMAMHLPPFCSAHIFFYSLWATFLNI